MTLEITETSLALFLAYARDAANWSGTPLVGGNVDSNPAAARKSRGNITQLKQAGLITTDVDEGCTWLHFTDAGRALAAQHGVTID